MALRYGDPSMLCSSTASLPFAGWPAKVVEVAEELYGATTGAAKRNGKPRILIREPDPVPVVMLCRAADPGKPVVAEVGTELRSAVAPAATELDEGARSACAETGEIASTASRAPPAVTRPGMMRQVEWLAMHATPKGCARGSTRAPGDIRTSAENA